MPRTPTTLLSPADQERRRALRRMKAVALGALIFMAVAFVIGNNVGFTASLLEPSTTIAALIANDFGEATETYRSALLLLGFVLFIVTFVVLAVARLMLLQLSRKEGNR